MMEHCGTKKIETERLILRHFMSDDAQLMFRNWASDCEVTRFLTWRAHMNTEVSRYVMDEWVNSYTDEKFYQWAIVPKDVGEPIGSIACVSMNEDVGCVQIGYCIGRKWWHMGYTSEALKAVIDFFFDEVGADRIEARHDPRNPHSGGVMKKCGMPVYPADLGLSVEDTIHALLGSREIRDKYLTSSMLWDLGLLGETAEKLPCP